MYDVIVHVDTTVGNVYDVTVLCRVNDVQATGDNSFYFTNCHYYATSVGMMAEVLLDLPWSTVVHYDGASYTVVAEGIKSANGIAMSTDHKLVRLSSCLHCVLLAPCPFKHFLSMCE